MVIDIKRAARIKEIDALIASPSERARAVFDFLKESGGDKFTTWDIVCFSVEYMAMMLPVYPFFEPAARLMSKILFTAHYYGGMENQDELRRPGVASQSEDKGRDATGEPESNGNGPVSPSNTNG